jgi:hypothetical protein
MANKNKTKCLFCRELFAVDVRNRGRQKYCPKPECQRASKAASQRRWLKQPQNRNYFRDTENAARVRRWQKEHPGYWRNTRRHRGRTLQEACPRNPLSPQENNASSEGPQAAAASPLQEALYAPGPLLIGLIATLVDSPLQDDIAQTSRRLLQLGQDILKGANHDDQQTGAAP